MLSQVEFRSDKFPATDDDTINPGLWGDRLARYLAAKLRAAGVETGMPYAEDLGWVVPVENREFPLWIGCGHQSGDDDQFLCFIEPGTPTIRRFFRTIDTAAPVGRVREALERILAADPEIREVRWFAEE